MSYFIHRSLTPQRKRIRLVHLLPDECPSPVKRSFGQEHEETRNIKEGEASDTVLSCTISHVNLDDAPPYTALSYAWGPQTTRMKQMSVNGGFLDITENLEAALRNLKPRNAPLTLWIDFLCIDQTDDLEKTEQLEQMRQIYSQATLVVAWLGAARDNSDIAMEWIHEYGERAHDLGIGSQPDLLLRHLLEAVDGNKLATIDTELEAYIKDLNKCLSPESPYSASYVAALSTLLTRSYWTRIWVVQELVSASSVVFRCGNIEVTETALHHALRLLRNYRLYQILKSGQHHSATKHPGHSIIMIETRQPVILLKFRRSGGPFPLIYLMRSLRRFQATDPRDKVFGLLGISLDAKELGIRPDYRRSCREVYVDLAQRLLKHGYAEILGLCEASNKIEDLPSWAPDWSRVHITRHPLQERSLDRSSKGPLRAMLQPLFSASGTDSLIESPPTPPLGLGQILSLYATIIGPVTSLGSPWKDKAVGSWLQDIRNLSQSTSNPLELSEEQNPAIWRISLCDQELRRGTKKPRVSHEFALRLQKAASSHDFNTIDEKALVDSGVGAYYEQLQTLARGRRPILVSNEHLGISPRETEIGDVLVILSGAKTPHILRPNSQGVGYILVGEAYIHKMMDGEALKDNPTLEAIIIS